jgi:hypothetical protein
MSLIDLDVGGNGGARIENERLVRWRRRTRNLDLRAIVLLHIMETPAHDPHEIALRIGKALPIFPKPSVAFPTRPPGFPNGSHGLPDGPPNLPDGPPDLPNGPPDLPPRPPRRPPWPSRWFP